MQVFFIIFVLSCIIRSIDVLDPENQPGSGIRTGSGAYSGRRLKKRKKEGYQNYLKYSLNRIFNSSHRVNSPGSKFGENRIRKTVKYKIYVLVIEHFLSCRYPFFLKKKHYLNLRTTHYFSLNIMIPKYSNNLIIHSLIRYYLL